ncbi:MAG: metal ABC transporter solute-binding protein, Zn/Mn family [Lachnospiraceae bacterium]
MTYKSILKNKIITLAATLLVLICAMTGTLLSGCASQQTQSDFSDKLNIVTTTTMLYDLTTVIGGEQVHITGLMGPGIDPHLYQASAGDVTKMQEADVVVYNGLHLEGKMGDIFASLSEQGRSVICIEDGLEHSRLLADAENPELYDPHIWFDVSIWKEAARYVAVRLGEIDPDHVDIYTANAEAYLKELTDLEQYIGGRMEELPEKQRVLITAHDAFGYFGQAYDFEVMGLQGISTDAEAGTADVSRLAELITERRIKAIFIESSVPAKSIEALQAAVQARGFEVAIGGELYSDALGDESSGHNTYILTVKANVDTIVDALK